MRIYLSKKQGKYNQGFYPSGRVPDELVQEWVEAGIACPASDDNVALWPEKTEPVGFEAGPKVGDPDLDSTDSGDGDHAGLLNDGEEYDNGA